MVVLPTDAKYDRSERGKQPFLRKTVGTSALDSEDTITLSVAKLSLDEQMAFQR